MKFKVCQPTLSKLSMLVGFLPAKNGRWGYIIPVCYRLLLKAIAAGTQAYSVNLRALQ